MDERSYTVAELARYVGGTLLGEAELRVRGLNRIEYAVPGELTFVHHVRYAQFLPRTQATCVLVPLQLEAVPRAGQAFIRVPDPYRAFVALMPLFVPNHEPPWGLRHPTAVIDPSATVAPTAVVSAYCVVGARCVVADRVLLHPFVVLYDGVTVGEGSVLHAGVICYPRTVIGRGCLIHAGVVLGADGFGFWEGLEGKLEKIPHVGNVVVEDEVELGANTTVDRALAGSTRIGRGSKVDNLVHIAHNVDIDAHTAIAAQVGISGSVRLGKRNRIGGQVGMVGHISTGDDVVVEAKSGVSKSLPRPGRYFGIPAQEHYRALRQEAAVRQLPELLRELRLLRQQLDELRQYVTWLESRWGQHG